MKNENFQRYRGKLNFYGGVTLGALTPIALTRYSYGSIEHSGNLAIDCLKEGTLLVGATIQSLPWQIFALPAGLSLGIVSCMELSNQRKKKKLEDI